MLELQAVLDIQKIVLSTAWSHDLAVFLARWAIYINVFLAYILVISKSRKDNHAVYEAAWSAALALLLTALIALVFGRARPYLASADVLLLIPPPLNTSFPSGHTATAAAVAFAFIWTRRDVGLAAFAVMGLVALGRFMAGVHYPSDLLGGLAVGALSFGVVRVLHHQLLRRDIKRK
jgi:undecaprenyl-diphosphatase